MGNRTLRKCPFIETINEQFKNVVQTVHSKPKSVMNFTMNALAAYCFAEDKPSINIDFSTEEQGGGAALFLNKTFYNLTDILDTPGIG